jgi:hypothetical protein
MISPASVPWLKVLLTFCLCGSRVGRQVSLQRQLERRAGSAGEWRAQGARRRLAASRYFGRLPEEIKPPRQKPSERIEELESEVQRLKGIVAGLSSRLAEVERVTKQLA